MLKMTVMTCNYQFQHIIWNGEQNRSVHQTSNTEKDTLNDLTPSANLDLSPNPIEAPRSYVIRQVQSNELINVAPIEKESSGDNI